VSRSTQEIIADVQTVTREAGQDRLQYLLRERGFVTRIDALEAELRAAQAAEAELAPAALKKRLDALEASKTQTKEPS
jgi:hypothetical protein